MKSLNLNLKGIYFDQIKDGKKIYEYRLCTDYWKKRLEGRHYKSVIIKRGYPKNGDTDKIIEVAWIGWHKETITHEHFGDNPVKVYAIDVSDNPPF